MRLIVSQRSRRERNRMGVSFRGGREFCDLAVMRSHAGNALGLLGVTDLGEATRWAP